MEGRREEGREGGGEGDRPGRWRRVVWGKGKRWGGGGGGPVREGRPRSKRDREGRREV